MGNTLGESSNKGKIMELRHLRYFIAVAEHKSIRLASERIHVTQPAVSRQIHDLEKELGLALFDRHPRGLTLTTAGQSFLVDVRKLMTDLEAAARKAKQISTGWAGRLRLGFVENSSWDGIVPKALRNFQVATPSASLELSPLNTPEQIQRIEDGLIDGGFVYQYRPFSEGLSTLRLDQHDLLLAIPVDWNLSGDHITLKEVAERPFITFPRWVYPVYYDHLMAACVERGITLNVVQEEQTESAILALVGSGIGAALVNSANLGRPPASVRFLKLADLSLAMPLVFAYRSDNDSPMLLRFVKALTDALHGNK
ncbi:LysR family transcriptional regulator [Pseudomonas sp. MH10]|uniref:LysR family transcriptional regulator n=2 Tax=unclassified Pseudomonas TaxID=196821 RepID=UPI002AC989F5|nr:LysR family transcriptional regulator [Pseudomonas sp. MH10]MEB0042577.1 LysR family transcriptional regulator [Pseudomonas sp. MH10]WPX64512.1 LysR family transcriptional regulator [Pseudomonas sp. MH10]